MSNLPSGTVAFLFTDIEGSTRLWQADASAMRTAVARHFTLLETAIAHHGGIVFKTIGDAVCAAFPAVPAGAAAALDAQRSLAAENWQSFGLQEPVRVRMAVHAGHTEPRDGDYFGPPLNRVARLLSTGHGGQVLLSEAAMALVRGHLPPGALTLDLGIHRLKDLLEPEHVTQLVHPDLPASFPPLLTLDARPHNLPLHLTPLLGREREVDELTALLGRDDVRIVTLTGPGGTGKTRLSSQVAAELLDAYPDGVWFVPLAALVDPTLVLSAIAEALGIRESGGAALRDLIIGHLQQKRLVLVLDNFEQVLEAAPAVRDLLTRASGVKALITSRAPLRIGGEREYPVAPLGLPSRKPPPPPEQLSQYAAVQLFLQRAEHVRPDFAITNETAPAIAEICHRLDGLPLAIELAAARARLLSPQAMLDRLEQRLPLLTGGARDLPERQQTLRAAIAWSYDLLSEDEQKLYRRLSVFAGGWTLEAAEAMAGTPMNEELGLDVLTGLERLVEHSLVRHEPSTAGGDRFTMLETIREYGLERLAQAGEADEAYQRHATEVVRLVAQAESELVGSNQGVWLERLDAEHDNIRVALTYVLRVRDTALAQAIAAPLWRFWWLHGHLWEGRRWLDAVLSLPGEAVTSGRAYTLRAAAELGEAQSDYDQALALFEQTLAVARQLGDRGLEARVLDAQGNIAHDRGNYEEARHLHHEAIALYEEVGDQRALAAGLANLGNVSFYEGDLDAAEHAYSRSLKVFRELDARHNVGMILSNLGAVAHVRGDEARSSQLHQESLAIMQELGDEGGRAIALANLAAPLSALGHLSQARDASLEALMVLERLGETRSAAMTRVQLGAIALTAGELNGAVPYLTNALRVFYDLSDTNSIAETLETLAEAATLHGESHIGARLLGATTTLRARLGVTLTEGEQASQDRILALVRREAGESAFATNWSAGCALPLEEVVAEALQLADTLVASPA